MKTKRNYLFILLFTIIIFVVYMFSTFISIDEVWNFSFSYNIINGYLPYKDFNMIITPLYPLIIAVFLKLPLDKYILYMIANSFLAANIIYQVKERKDNYIVTISLLVLLLPFTYNTLIILLYYLLIKYDDNDKLSGILVALIFLTKQSIGVFFFIVMLLFSKNRFKRFIYFLIPIFIFLIYLFASNTIEEFINLGFLGLFEFANKNTAFDKNTIIILIFNIGATIALIIKSKFKDRKYLYMLALQAIAFPIIEMYHVLTAAIPLYSLLLAKIKNKYVTNIINIIIIIFTVLLIISGLDFSHVPNNTKILKYRNLGSDDLLKETKKFIKDNDDANIVIVSQYATYLKEELDLEPSPFDLPLYGNMGINGTKDFINYIDNMCEEKCYIIFEEYDNWQLNKEVVSYVKDNYTMYNEYIYTNK